MQEEDNHIQDLETISDQMSSKMKPISLKMAALRAIQILHIVPSELTVMVVLSGLLFTFWQWKK